MPLAHSTAETRAWLLLLRAPGLGPAAIRKLVAEHTSPEAAVEAAVRDGDDEARAWFRTPDESALARDQVWLDDPQHHLVTLSDEDYPPLLRNGQNPPAVLFVVGEPALLWSPQIAIVGARRATAGGLDNARAFARTFAQGGDTVTSGLAEGIDAAAHTGALDAGGKTIAVMGTGPDIVYPTRNAALAARIVENGALVTGDEAQIVADAVEQRRLILDRLSKTTGDQA